MCTNCAYIFAMYNYMEFKCDKCEKTFATKYSYIRHTKRKKPCTEQIGSKNDTEHICKTCGKRYSSYRTLHNHNKKCKGTKVMNNTQINNTLIQENYVNVGDVNVGGDVKVVKFGDENLDYISDDLYKHILGRGFKAVSEFIEHSHFNKDHPENHNIYIANIKENYIIMYDGDKWTISKKDEVMEDIIYAKSDFLNIKFKELMNQMDKRDIIKFQRFINQRDEDKTMNKLKDELKLQLYNNRFLPQQLRKQMEQKNRVIKNDDDCDGLEQIMGLLENLDDTKMVKLKNMLNNL